MTWHWDDQPPGELPRVPRPLCRSRRLKNTGWQKSGYTLDPDQVTCRKCHSLLAQREADEAFTDMLASLKAAHAYLENAGPVVLVEQMKTAIDKAEAR
jgi:hypothetical protein